MDLGPRRIMYREEFIGNSMASSWREGSVVFMVGRTFQGHLCTFFALGNLAVSEQGNMC